MKLLLYNDQAHRNMCGVAVVVERNYTLRSNSAWIVDVATSTSVFIVSSRTGALVTVFLRGGRFLQGECHDKPAVR